MPRHTPTPDSSQSIPEMVDDVAREEMRRMVTDDKLPAIEEEQRRLKP